MAKENTDNAFDISDEDFDNMLNAGMAGEVSAEENEDGVINLTLSNDDDDDQNDGLNSDSQDDLDIDVNGILDDDDDDDKSQNNQGVPQTMTIVHNGKEQELTLDEVRNFAQKGYDYETKTKQLAPHRRLITLVEEDEDLQGLINNYVVGKSVGEVKKREDFDTEEDWLQANLENVLAKTNPFTTGKSEAENTSTTETDINLNTNPAVGVYERLQARDKENYESVVPVMMKVAQQLSVADYNKITQSEDMVIKFYDKVKEQVVGQGSNSGGNNNVNTGHGKQRTFNLRSNRTAPGKRTPKKNVWELSDNEFEKQIQRAKGY